MKDIIIVASVILGVVVSSAAGYFFSVWLGIIESVLTLALFFLYLYLRSRRRKRFLKYLESSLLNADTLSSKSMMTFPLPMTVVRLQSGEIIWCNNSFKELSNDRTALFETRLTDIIPGFELHWLSDGAAVCPYDISYSGKIYTIYGALFDEGDPSSEDDDMVILYWEDKTELISLQRRIEDKSVICAEIVFDNYDEVMSNLSDSRKSEIQAALEKELSLWASPAGGIMRKVDRDRFIFVFEEKYLKTFVEDKFSIKKQLQQNPVTAEAATTLSIGIGRDGETLRDNMHNARLALDMAGRLFRGPCHLPQRP